MIPTRLTLALAAFVATISVATAHHGWSGYEEKLITLTGTIEQPSYSNPHGSIRLKTPEKTWVVVLAPPSRMQNRGLSKEMLKVGAQASVEGYAHLEKKEEMRAERITLDGKTVELR